jgi:uncharacterized repeat protein (TIGR03803 family)
MLTRLCVLATLVAPVCSRGATFTDIYDFADRGGVADGVNPLDPVLFDNAIYGATVLGGTPSNGTVFKVDLSGHETVLHYFAGGSDGKTPAATVTVLGGILYGTTSDGGASSNGTVYQLDLSSGAESVLYSFAGGNDGAQPSSTLTFYKGYLYGTTLGGGADNSGTIFRIDPTSGIEKTVYTFDNGKAGINPDAGLVAYKGHLYGTASRGGFGYGAVFKFNPGNDTMATVHYFNNTDGSLPESDMIVAGGVLYGCTEQGGDSTTGYGTVFEVDLASGTFTSLHSFTGSDGDAPAGKPAFLDGALYVTALFGGGARDGTVVRITPSTGATTIVQTFSPGIGTEPTGLVVQKGIFYGAAEGGGGPQGYGAIYKFTR